MKGTKTRLHNTPHMAGCKKRKSDTLRTTRSTWLNPPQWFDVQNEYSPGLTNYTQQQYPAHCETVHGNHNQYHTAVGGAAVRIPTFETVPSHRYAVASSKSSPSFTGRTKTTTRTKAAQQAVAAELQQQNQLKMMTSNLPAHMQHQLQQYLQQLQQQQHQQQQHQQQQQQRPQQPKSMLPSTPPVSQQQHQYNQHKLLHPNTPPPPTYSEQMQAAYQAYLLQQRRFNQQQNELLEQLYQNCPQITPASLMESTRLPNETGGSTSGSRSGLQSQSAFQPQQQQHQQQNPFYTAQQHCSLMQQQHNNVLRDQHNVMHQHYDPSKPPKTIQLYGMAVPESSVLPSAQFMQY